MNLLAVIFNKFVTSVMLFAKFFHVNPFSTNVPLLYSLKTSENLRFSDVFRGYRSGTLVENGLMKSFDSKIVV